MKRYTENLRVTMRDRSSDCGFALVATLMLMVLLAILAVGLLSLSAVTLRTAGLGSAQAQARANARMAMMVAIGELQKQAGPDTRVTAPSGIADESGPPLTGVWKSWEGTDHETTGRPVAPVYGDKKRKEADGGRFLAWLVSGAGMGGDPADPSALASTAPSESTVPLLSTGTLGEGGEGQVHLVPQPANGSGTLAWWVGGENQKARLPRHYEPANKTAAGWSDLAKSHAVADPEPFGLEKDLLVVPTTADKAITLPTANLLAANAAKPPREFFHDLSVSSTGLLTNTATGGWRKDMSLVTENWDNLNPSSLPFFRFSPNGGDTSGVEKPTSSATGIRAPQSLLYPWSGYGNGAGKYTYNYHGAVASWRSLLDFATSYRTRVAPSADGTGAIPFSWSILDDSAGNGSITDIERYKYLHTVRTTPLIARIHWLFSHRTEEYKDGEGQPTNPRTYRLRLLVTPVVTLCNPFNASMPMPAQGIMIRLAKSPPCVIEYYKRDGITKMPARKLMTGSATAGTDSAIANYPDRLFNVISKEYRITDPAVLLPGETRVYSPPENSLSTGVNINLAPGYRATGGHAAYIDFIAPVAADRLQEGDKIRMDLKFDNLININGAGSGVFLDIFHNQSPYRNLYMRYLMTVARATAEAHWPPITNDKLPAPTAGEIAGASWKPFFSTVFGPRVASDTSFPGKGFTQNSPLVSFTYMTPTQANPGWNHPGNSAFTYSFFPHALGGDDTLPNANNSNNRGYIVSGFGAAKGLSRVVLNELPLRPMASLAELQGWDLRAHNPYPPFQLNIIGNSDASPLIPANHVVNPGADAATNYQHDDSYCANHVLFDDWFFSSIAPEPASFGNSITSMEARYKEFLSGAKPLTNRSYRPILEDESLDAAAQARRYNEIIAFDGWQRVASRLEVEGMFNVNSTSVKAWRALLGHARNQQIPYRAERTAGGSVDEIRLSGKTDYAFSRFSVASDTKAGDQGMSGGQIWSSEFTGYRVFDDGLLDLLAEKIVEQVRLRGPFLSLSEFVNRQLGENEDLAVAGAIQTALNRMSVESGAKDPYKELKDPELSRPTNPDDPKLAGAGYKFKRAGLGYSTYGMPGWIRQADVLRPLAPILSARDDTFTIRSYGDSRDKAGNILAKAWCEATVRRTRDFVDPADPADSIDTPSIAANVLFGRRFAVISFRWLSPHEV